MLEISVIEGCISTLIFFLSVTIFLRVKLISLLLFYTDDAEFLIVRFVTSLDELVCKVET